MTQWQLRKSDNCFKYCTTLSLLQMLESINIGHEVTSSFRMPRAVIVRKLHIFFFFPISHTISVLRMKWLQCLSHFRISGGRHVDIIGARKLKL